MADVEIYPGDQVTAEVIWTKPDGTAKNLSTATFEASARKVRTEATVSVSTSLSDGPNGKQFVEIVADDLTTGLWVFQARAIVTATDKQTFSFDVKLKE